MEISTKQENDLMRNRYPEFTEFSALRWQRCTIEAVARLKPEERVVLVVPREISAYAWEHFYRGKSDAELQDAYRQDCNLKKMVDTYIAHRNEPARKARRLSAGAGRLGDRGNTAGVRALVATSAATTSVATVMTTMLGMATSVFPLPVARTISTSADR